MSEIKRVQFTTISAHTSQNSIALISGGSGITAASCETGSTNSINANSGFGTGSVTASTSKSVNNTGSNSSNSGKNKTFRYDLELFEPDSKVFPEFNFSKMMHIEKKKQKKLKQIQTNGVSDPFEENDDDVARIAKEMEEKYGKSYVSGRRKTKHNDLCDKGLGYDESDSFIDNTEAYDELIPDEVETIAGGFYINSGQLEFTKLTKYEIETEEIVKRVRSKKRVLSSSSEESDEDGDSVASQNIDVNDEIDISEKSNSKKRKETQEEKIKNGHRDKKQKSSGEESSSSKSKIRESKKIKEDMVFKDNNAKSGDDGTNSDNGKEKPTLKTTTVKDMLKAKRDNYLKMQDDKKFLQNGVVKSGNDSSESTGEDSGSDSGPSKKKYKTTDEEDVERLRSSDTKLPDNLSSEILADISELIEFAKCAIKTGKKFRFDEKSSEVFIRCDDNASCLDKEIRNQIFAHLEYQMELPKYYLIKKGKQMRIKQEKSKIKKAYIKLKNAIAKVMPSVINSYEATYKQISELRAKASSSELEKPDPSLKLPRKKFPWNDAMRNLLFDLYQTRWTSYTVLRTRKEKFEDFVNSYLRDKVVPIWPNGWMKLEELQKELEKRKNQSKKLKDSKKINLNAASSSNVLDKLQEVNTAAVVSKESMITTGSSSPSVNVKVNDDSSTTTNQMSQLSSVTISSSITAHSKPNFANEVPQKLPENSISIIPVVQQEPILSKSQKPSNVLNSNNKISIDKVPHSNSNNDNNKVDKLANSTSKQNSITVDIISPSKRTDHSINSIISNTSPTSLNSATVSSVSTTSTNRSSSGSTSTTHIINVDDFKNTTDIIQTSNKLLGNNSNKTGNQHHNSNNNNNDNKSMSNTDCAKSSNNNNNNNEKMCSSNSSSSSSGSGSSSSRKKESKKKNRDRDGNSKSKTGSTEPPSGSIVTENISNRRETIESIGSSSDSVEFIDEKLPVPSSTSGDKKIVTVNKNKYITNKTEYNNKSRSASPVNYTSKNKINKESILLNERGGGGGSSDGPPPPPSVLQSSRLISPLLSGAKENDNLTMRNMNSNSNFSKNNFTETTEAVSVCSNETKFESRGQIKDVCNKTLEFEQIKKLGETTQSNIETPKLQQDSKKQ
ncbi:yemanuclein [Condylostylus longicornis]|uniref:yemanuclein n=1 Tax=Condylostylus longicornis TaxID=2530218 RepID=UPI00244DD59A|nr:yemanuclein [Condylostylus longicornis]XP_055380994.1 yemanuclein [Condylostylus longicornis]